MIKWLLALVLGLYLMIVGLVSFVGYETVVQGHQSERNNIALCALRDARDKDIAERILKIHRSTDFLADHPQGIPGIPAKLFVRGIQDDQRTLNALRRSREALDVLKCD